MAGYLLKFRVDQSESQNGPKENFVFPLFAECLNKAIHCIFVFQPEANVGHAIPGACPCEFFHRWHCWLLRPGAARPRRSLGMACRRRGDTWRGGSWLAHLQRQVQGVPIVSLIHFWHAFPLELSWTASAPLAKEAMGVLPRHVHSQVTFFATGGATAGPCRPAFFFALYFLEAAALCCGMHLLH